MDVVVVGAGTFGCYVIAIIVNAGYDVTIVERKPEKEVSHAVYDDVLEGTDAFLGVIPELKTEPAFANTEVDHGHFEILQEGTVLDIPVPGELAVIDHWGHGWLIIEGAEKAGAGLHYDTVVQGTKQDDGGTITGIVAKYDDGVIEYDANIVISGAGSLPPLQDKVGFSDATFDTNVSYQCFSSAYREIVEVPESVEWPDALAFKPAEVAMGYVWYFPWTETEINAGLDFQAIKEPMRLIDDLKRDLREHPESEDAEVVNRLGAALPTRYPYGSTTAPGYMTADDTAAHVNPTAGGGVASTAYADRYVGEQVTIAFNAGDMNEGPLWRYSQCVIDHFGGRYASLDVYSILSTVVDVDDLMGLITLIPNEKLVETLYPGTTSFDPALLAQTVVSGYGHQSRICEFFKIKHLADELLARYGHYSNRPSALEGWQVERGRIMDDIYEFTGTDPKC